MARQTRSGAQFSPYELDGLKLRPRQAEVIRIGISIGATLAHAMQAAEERAARLEESIPDDGDKDWEDDDGDVSSRPPSPLSNHSSPLTSPPSSLPPSPPVHPLPLPSLDSPPFVLEATRLKSATHAPPNPASPGSVEKQRRKTRGAARRADHRQRRARTPYDRPQRYASTHNQDHRREDSVKIAFDIEMTPSSSGGSWLGPRSSTSRGRMFTPDELVKQGCQLIKWNGRDPKLIVDAENRIVAVLLGRPDDPDWDFVVQQAAKAMHRARRDARRLGIWSPFAHRRGVYLALTTGVSFGGGQRRPGNLVNTRRFRHIIERLLRNKYVRRLAGFQSSGLALYAPKLYRYYCSILKALFAHYPDLVHNFTNSVFPAATFNCGPDAVTVDHVDFLNLSHGFCGLSSGGLFDHTRGGHIHMRTWRVYIECPSGSSLLIPSGCVNHGNTPIRRGETRHSMTQYAAGGLFRWVTHGFQSAKSLLAQDGGQQRRAELDGEPGSRWRWATDLFSKVDELEADRREVFGR